MTKPSSALQHQAPGMRLSRRGLIALLLVVLSLPPSVAVLLYWTLPAVQQRPLKVDVQLRQTDAGAALAVRNTGDVPLRSLRVEVNEAFHYWPAETLPTGQQLELPLSWFAKKSGQHFRPDAWPVESVRVSARLPGNRTASLETKLN